MGQGVRTKSTWESIQWLRGIAALMVVWHHVREQFEPIKAQFPSEFGGAGVDIFFVISGFIMMLIARPGETPRNFLIKRAIRVIPLYWAATAALAAICLIAPSLLNSVQFTWPHLLQSLAFIPHYDGDGRIRPLLTLGWTLNYEMFFYLVFACFILLRPTRRLLAVAITLVAFVLAGALIHSQNAVWETYTNPMMLEFLAGMGLAHLVGNGLSARRAVGLTVLGIGAVLFVIMAALFAEIGIPHALVYGVPALLIVSGAVLLEPYWPRVRALVLLGNASYALYLSHIFTLGALSAIWSKLNLPIDGWGMSAFILSGTAASVAVGLMVHLLVESPFNNWAKRRAHTPSSDPSAPTTT